MKHRMIRPDIKGRITLGSLAKGVSSFSITVTKGNRIILEPYVEIPANEKWLFNNKMALNKVKQGLKEASQNKLSHLGSFAKHIEESDEQ